MKLCAKFSLFLAVAIAVMAITPVFAIDPAVREAGLAHQAQTFSNLLKRTECTLSTTTAIAPSDNTATSTISFYYLPDSYELPILVKIQNLGADNLQYVEYATVGIAGVTLPTASSAKLLATTGALCTGGLASEKVYYHAPTDLYRSASGSQDCVFEVWGIKGDE